MNRKWSKLIVIIIVILLAYVFYAYDLKQYLTIDYLKAQQDQFQHYYQENRVQTVFIYMAAYVLIAALSLPGAAVMTLAGGAMFGLGIGFVAISFASTIGATLAFLVARFLLRDYVQQKFGDNLTSINEGVRKDGAFYLFTLRLVPVFPFFAINLAMGLTPIRTWTYYWVSQVGMIAGTLVYVNAGTQLGRIESLKGILSPGLIISFALLGIFPLIAKKIVDIVKTRKALGNHIRPKRFDYNLIVIGAGSAGLVTSYIAAAVKAKVALVEKHKMGGDCLNTGCVPSKALIRSAKMMSYASRAAEFGFKTGQFTGDFAELMERVQQVVRQVEPHDSIERYTELGVDVIQGEARVVSPYEIEVNGKMLTTRNIVIATGARPFVPPIKGIDQINYLTSDNVWDLRELPKRLVVLGGGPIGCELTQTFARLGAQVSQVEMMPRIMGREDPEVSAMVKARFESEGVKVLTDHRALEVVTENDKTVLVCDHQGSTVTIEFDSILVAVGRVANTTGFGLAELGVDVAKNGTLETDPFLRTNFPNILCAGDVAGPYQFTHTAAHQAWFAAVNALFGTFKKFRADYRVIPWSTFTDPEVARVGLNETEAREKGIDYEITRYAIDDLDRAIADSENHGFVKVLTPPGKDTILGVTIVGAHAGDIISEYVLAMKHKLGLNKILGTIHIYPTLAEANKYAAGEWKKAHVPVKALQWVERYHTWRRGK
jgi:dihydrolipoamide dehydrogenase